MKHRTLVVFAALAAAVVLLLSVIPGQAQGPVGGAPQAIGTAFTYQGQLQKDGSLVNDTCDIEFKLYDALSGGSQVGATQTRGGVVVSAGLFTIPDLSFGAAAFAGEARFLEVAVKCAGDTAFTTLGTRQELTPAPYALYSAGAPWSGLTGVPDLQLRVAGACDAGNAIRVVHADGSVTCEPVGGGGAHDHWGETWTGSGTGLTLAGGGVGLSGSGSGYGLYGESAATTGRGVRGYATSATGQSAGVSGESASTAGIGVIGTNDNTTGLNYGLYGRVSSPSGYGLYAWNMAGSGRAVGVSARSNSTAGAAVEGWASATTGTNYGLYGQADGNDGRGVYGEASATSGYVYGVYGKANAPLGAGVYGTNQRTTGNAIGVFGSSASTQGRAVYGLADAATGINYGVYGESSSTSGTGVYGVATAATGGTNGVYGVAASTAGYGVYGEATATSGYVYGVYGKSVATLGAGVRGVNQGTSGYSAGVFGSSASTQGRGVYGIASSTTGTNYGLYGETASAAGYAGYFSGNVHVQGTLSKSGGSFKIDHPLNPANQYLYHSFVESPDMLNIYNGNVVLDENGAAWVELPAWFEALNEEFRYQLTCIGGYAPVYVAARIADNRFQIAGGTPGLEVSWLVTGVRHDPWAEAHRIPVEQDKPADERGTYLYPELYGVPREAGPALPGGER